ncbi:hypothetical protein [Phaeovulum sp. W22_SRMD_FR3]|uniref:hypothetical protein n=1 Tax=Phaeovulum sp. W22_SRMD_FR3 TaxID=3240274 RepID=UPI003F96F900
MNFLWFVRAARWARNPPSPGRVKLVFAVILLGLVIFGLDRAGLWPDWARMEKPPRHGVKLIAQP